MIGRAQAEALLKLAEALEECERNGLTFEPRDGVPLLLLEERHAYLEDGFTGIAMRYAVATLYPKSEA